MWNKLPQCSGKTAHAAFYVVRAGVREVVNTISIQCPNVMVNVRLARFAVAFRPPPQPERHGRDAALRSPRRRAQRQAPEPEVVRLTPQQQHLTFRWVLWTAPAVRPHHQPGTINNQPPLPVFICVNPRLIAGNRSLRVGVTGFEHGGETRSLLLATFLVAWLFKPAT